MKIKATKSTLVPCGYLVVAEDGRDMPVTLDYDFPSLASLFGYVACDCGCTDGSIDCEHKTASTMISEARSVIDNNLDIFVDAPGYFSDKVMIKKINSAFTPDIRLECRNGQ